jgi:methionyl-tRNA formyltransferase
MKIIFVGTADFGIPTLEKLKSLYEIPLIITQPDKPTGRKQALTAPPIKAWAEKNNIRTIQPEKIASAKKNIADVEPDLMIVAAYGQIIPLDVLKVPKKGSVNIHGSLLPKYRGSSPIQAAILNGEQETGITFIEMDEKMDHGPILHQARLAINDNQTFLEIYKLLAQLSAEEMAKFLPDFFAGKTKPVIQNSGQATYTKLITKNDGRIKWTNPAQAIQRQVMALNPEPGTWTILDDKSVKIIKTEVLIENKIELAGKLYRSSGNLAVKCADFSIKLLEVQPEGKKPMTGNDFLNGLKNLDTKIFV